jgi:hypothetical protein
VVNTAIAGKTVEDRLGQLTEFQLFVEDATQESQPSPGYCPLDTGDLINGASRQAKATFIAAD